MYQIYICFKYALYLVQHKSSLVLVLITELLSLAMAQMRYPYTLGAMLMQFPLKFHIQKSWVWKSYAIGLVPTGLLFLKITNSFSDAAPAKSGH